MRIFPLRSALSLAVGLLFGLLVALAAQPAPTAQAANPAAGADAHTPLAQVVLTPTKDNTIYEATANFRSNGVGDYVIAGQNGKGAGLRGLLAFDLAGSVPPSVTILSVTLQLDLEPPSKNPGPMDVRLHRVQADWGAGTSNAPQGEAQGAAAATGDATWRHTFFETTQWAATGGDFVATPSAVTTVNADAVYSWTSAQMLADLQAWIADPTSNFGWILVGDENQNADIKRFASRENRVNAAPQLIIVYEGEPVVEQLLYLPLVQN